MPLRSMPTDLNNHLQGDATTIASCWKITRKDGEVFRLTDTDVGVTLSDGYYSPAKSGTVSAVENTVTPDTDNLTIQHILDSDLITVEDLNAGLFDYAKVEIYLVNYEDPGQGTSTLFKGYFGEVKMRDDIDFEVELKALSTRLTQTLCRQYTQQCDADLGDARCGVDIESLVSYSRVDVVTSNQEFHAYSHFGLSDESAESSSMYDPLDDPDQYYRYGVLVWETGKNAGFKMEVKSHVLESPGARFVLFLPMPFEIQPEDEFRVYPGCDKYLNTCKDKFDNVVNFRGFPFIPGRDSASAYPDAN